MSHFYRLKNIASTVLFVCSSILFSQGSNLPKKYYPTGGEQEDILIQHEGYVSMMTKYNIPRWVLGYVDSLNVAYDDPTSNRKSRYPKDPKFPNLKSNALASSGYDHGHMFPAASLKYDAKLYKNSNRMTNIAPQSPCMNRKLWCQLESEVRKWAEKDNSKKYYTISGPVLGEWIDSICLKRDIKIYVPKNYFKVVLVEEKGKLIEGIGYIIENSDTDILSLSKHSYSINDIEKLTGLNFNPTLKKRQSNKIEKRKINLQYSPIPLDCKGGECDSYYGRMTKPENKKGKCLIE